MKVCSIWRSTLNFYANGTRRLYNSSTTAIVTIVENSTGVALLMPLACDLHYSKLRDGKNVVFCLVVRHGGFHSLVNLALVTLVFHIDEVDDDKTSEVAKSQLPSYLNARLDIGLENKVFSILAIDLVATCINIDRNQSFRFLDDYFST